MREEVSGFGTSGHTPIRAQSSRARGRPQPDAAVGGGPAAGGSFTGPGRRLPVLTSDVRARLASVWQAHYRRPRRNDARCLCWGCFQGRCEPARHCRPAWPWAVGVCGERAWDDHERYSDAKSRRFSDLRVGHANALHPGVPQTWYVGDVRRRARTFAAMAEQTARYAQFAMNTAESIQPEPPAPTRRSGHGAASVIPHLNVDRARETAHRADSLSRESAPNRIPAVDPDHVIAGGHPAARG
jgi:hypothetical protein